MSEYWKSTPSYWCKFCGIYVRDTGIERKNHEGSAKHQNNIQRSLRELQRGQERESREKQRAKDEVARLNGLVGGQSASAKSPQNGFTSVSKSALPSAPTLSSSQQRKAHAEQLAAMGIQLPDELKKELTGVGEWQVVSERPIAPEESAAGRSLAGIKAEAIKTEEDVKISVDAMAQGVRKRKVEDSEEMQGEENSHRKRVWGSELRKYPGNQTAADDTDLEDALSGISKKSAVLAAKQEETDGTDDVKQENAGSQTSIASIPEANDPDVSRSDDVATPVIFKKRKGKK